MDTKQKNRRNAAPVRRSRSTKAAPERRRKTGRAGTPDREERKLRVQQRRKAKIKNPPRQQRVIRPPREEVPNIVYTAPKPMYRGLFAWKLISMAAVVVAVFLGLSVFFRVDTITVAGADKYTPWMIRQASGVETGDGLLSISEARVASRIISGLPYIDEVKVSRKLPGTVEIQVTELQVTYSIEDENGGWWLISSSGRAIEAVSLEKALGYTRVEGLAIRTPTAGEQVQALPGKIIDPGEGTAVEMDQTDADQQLAALVSIMTGLERSRIIGEITVIDVTTITDLRLEYPQLLTVRLGDDEQLEYKISYLAAAVEKLEANQSGELDLTLEYTEKAVFTPAR
ncbi:MAG: FtsQ-type POTRA domain-containing protein [Oscillospiraceae bacterium]|nr:FtsQ-type POTRA domain-containing protein [Oscillospiraceae bacterium]